MSVLLGALERNQLQKHLSKSTGHHDVRKWMEMGREARKGEREERHPRGQV